MDETGAMIAAGITFGLALVTFLGGLWVRHNERKHERRSDSAR
jgi:hypothetical protein